MLKKAVLFIAALLLLTAGFQQPKSKAQGTAGAWAVFAPKDGRFSVMLPGKPLEESLGGNAATGPFTVPAYKLASGECGYMITYRDYADVPEEVEARDQRIQMAAEKAVTSAGGKLLSSEAISLGNHPGREVKAEIPGSILQTRTYFVRPRLYVLMIFMPVDKTDSEYVTKFFKSFKVLPAQEVRPTVAP